MRTTPGTPPVTAGSPPRPAGDPFAPDQPSRLRWIALWSERPPAGKQCRSEVGKLVRPARYGQRPTRSTGVRKRSSTGAVQEPQTSRAADVRMDVLRAATAPVGSRNAGSAATGFGAFLNHASVSRL